MPDPKVGGEPGGCGSPLRVTCLSGELMSPSVLPSFDLAESTWPDQRGGRLPWARKPQRACQGVPVHHSHGHTLP